MFLDKHSLIDKDNLISAHRLQRLLSICEKPPLLVVILSCYSSCSIQTLAETAPFVITAVGQIDDELCLEFVKCFYDRFFSGYSIAKAFEDTLNLLKAKICPQKISV